MKLSMSITINKPLIRAADESDIEKLTTLESTSGEGIWSESDFLLAINDSNCSVIVFERDQEIVAFLIYEIYKKELHIICCVVDRNNRRLGIGETLFNYANMALTTLRKKCIIVEVKESDLYTQLFLRQMGYRCVKIVKDWHIDSKPMKLNYIENGYRFRKNHDINRE